MPDSATQSDSSAFGDEARLLGAARLAFYTPVVDQPSVADRKATFLLTMTGLVATTLFLFVDSLARLVGGPDRIAAVGVSVLVASLIGLLLGAAKYAYGAYTSPLPGCEEPTFFRHIAGRNFDAYLAELKGTDLQKAVEAILHYNYSAASQAAAKYRGVNRAQKYMILAIPIWMAVMLVVALAR